MLHAKKFILTVRFGGEILAAGWALLKLRRGPGRVFGLEGGPVDRMRFEPRGDRRGPGALFENRDRGRRANPGRIEQAGGACHGDLWQVAFGPPSALLAHAPRF